MSNPVPNITALGAQASITAVTNALITHFSTVSTQYTLVDSNAGTDFLIAPVSTNESWDVRFTNSSSRLQIYIDPVGGRTDSSSGAGSSQISPTGFYGVGFVVPASCPNVHVVEFDDAVFILGRDSTDSFWEKGLHFGRIATPTFPGDIDDGLTGLGAIGEEVGLGNYQTAQYWFTDGGGTGANEYGNPENWVMQIALTTWATYGAAEGNGFTMNEDPTEAECTVGGAVIPSPIVTHKYITGARRIRNTLKYIYTWWVANPSDTIITDGNGNNYVHVWQDATNQKLVISWDASTTP